MGPENQNPLNELQLLEQQIDQITELAGLKPIFFRVDELAKEHSGDFEVQLAVSEVKQRVVTRGTVLKQSGQTMQSAAPVLADLASGAWSCRQPSPSSTPPPLPVPRFRLPIFRRADQSPRTRLRLPGAAGFRGPAASASEGFGAAQASRAPAFGNGQRLEECAADWSDRRRADRRCSPGSSGEARPRGACGRGRSGSRGYHSPRRGDSREWRSEVQIRLLRAAAPRRVSGDGFSGRIPTLGQHHQGYGVAGLRPSTSSWNRSRRCCAF